MAKKPKSNGNKATVTPVPSPKGSSTPQIVRRNKMGAPTKFREHMIMQAEALGAMGLTLEETARILDINYATLWRYARRHPDFGKALQRGAEKANLKVRESVFKNATQRNNLGAQVFWLKNRAGWKDQPVVDNSKHLHLTVQNQEQVKKMNDEELIIDVKSIVSKAS